MLARLRLPMRPWRPRPSAAVGSRRRDGDPQRLARRGQGVRLSEGFPLDERVPMLLDALNVWHRRAESETIEASRAAGGSHAGAAVAQRALRPTARPLDRMVDRVRRESSRARAAQPSRPSVAAAQASRAPRRASSAFAPRPTEDPSSTTPARCPPASTDGRTRYVEAVEQMMRFLQAPRRAASSASSSSAAIRPVPAASSSRTTSGRSRRSERASRASQVAELASRRRSGRR